MSISREAKRAATDIARSRGESIVRPNEGDQLLIQHAIDTATSKLREELKESLAALELGLVLEEKGNMWSVNPSKFQAFLEAARAALTGMEGK